MHNRDILAGYMLLKEALSQTEKDKQAEMLLDDGPTPAPTTTKSNVSGQPGITDTLAGWISPMFRQNIPAYVSKSPKAQGPQGQARFNAAKAKVDAARARHLNLQDWANQDPSQGGIIDKGQRALKTTANEILGQAGQAGREAASAAIGEVKDQLSSLWGQHGGKLMAGGGLGIAGIIALLLAMSRGGSGQQQQLRQPYYNPLGYQVYR